MGEGGCQVWLSAGLLSSLASSSHGEHPMGILHPGAEGSEDATWGQSLYEVIKAEFLPIYYCFEHSGED